MVNSENYFNKAVGTPITAAQKEIILEQRLRHQPDIPLLSRHDVTTLLKMVLPRIDATEEEVLRQLEVQEQKEAGIN